MCVHACVCEDVKTFCYEIIPEMKGSVTSDEILSCKLQDGWPIGPVGHI